MQCQGHGFESCLGKDAITWRFGDDGCRNGRRRRRDGSFRLDGALLLPLVEPDVVDSGEAVGALTTPGQKLHLGL